MIVSEILTQMQISPEILGNICLNLIPFCVFIRILYPLIREHMFVFVIHG